jgi:menaquinone-dependent protoporphyrinogen oxidase
MRILVAYGSKNGGTWGLARMVAAAMEELGVAVEVRDASEVRAVSGYDAVVVGGALYMFRWHRAARRFVRRHAQALRGRPVWLFSSGPLDDSASKREVPPVPQVRALMQRIGARGHATFGGRLEPGARGFLARQMAKTHAGDWRDPDRVGAWAAGIVATLRHEAVAADPAAAPAELAAAPLQ